MSGGDSSRVAVEGEGQDAVGIVRRQPRAQLADPLRDERHESLVSLHPRYPPEILEQWGALEKL